ncbi:MAG: heavy metal translocating P-type ATPase [Eubacteriales bacterium]|nr:heavy metal translocating P-type ATPase [Eubacteriales bacterium]
MAGSITKSKGCCCGEVCEFEEEERKPALYYFGIVLFIVGIVINFYFKQASSYSVTAVFFISYLLIGKDILLAAGRNILAGKVFDENFLMSIASIGAFLIGEYPEAVAVMLFYRIGEALQDRAVDSSRKSISALLDIRPDTANLKTPEGIRVTGAENVRPNDIIIVKAGEKVPLDGIVKKGISTVDTKALTGESLPRDVNAGATVLSGSINGQGLLEIEVTKRLEESAASKIIDLVQNASSKKAKTENFITKFAAYYTPAVVGIAAALAVIPPFVLGLGSFEDWMYRALIFLVISCPCALVISIPIGFFGGIGAASSKGILIKGSNYLEALNAVDTVIFDKTGTLTSGIFKVTKIINREGYTQEDVLRYGAYAEYHSTHPIATSVKNKYFENPANTIDETQISELTENAGFGVKVQIGGKTILAGNYRLMEEERISAQPEDEIGTIVYIAIDGRYAGAIVISDEAKADSANTIHRLHALGIKKIAMLTGDNKKIGEKIGQELNIDEVYGGLLPHQKVEVLESIMEDRKKQNGGKKKGTVIFAGDGINDAPVLARADIGIAMGGVGSDAAIEAADIVLMNDEPSKVITAIQIAGKTRRIVWQNIIGALSVKGVILLLGALGYATMWGAVFADVGVAILAVMNSVRTGRIIE